ncbi:MAG: TIGR01906 family membrane protein [Dehalococcoidia bacterium]|nr:TIGR01906 family membrane protein [Dehalococcoidia bacterium]
MLAARWIASALFVAAIPIFLLLSNVRIAALEPRVFEYSFAQYDAAGVTGIERIQLDRAAREIVGYFQGSDSDALLDIRVSVEGQQQPLFNQREVLHMRDVKQLFDLTFRVHEIAFVYIAGYIAAVVLWSRERSMRRLARQAVLAGVVTAGALGIAGIAMLVGFDSLFTQFHLLSFSNDFWRLDPATDHLIQMFPQGFWFDVSIGVGVLTVMEGGLLALAGVGYLAWLDRDRPRWRSGRPSMETRPATESPPAEG